MSQDFDAQAFLRDLTTQPGVYRMLAADDEVLYVGKARNLKKRVGSYFLRASGHPRIEAMVDQVAGIEVTITGSEDEALLLESSLIKRLRPRYNVLLRDDKSYPYLRLSGHAFPRIAFHRGARKPEDDYFGPFPSAATVRETMGTLQRIFLLRDCSDSYFENRSRPCLQYQIQRCSAPCVGKISPADYRRQVAQMRDVMRGRSSAVIETLQADMDAQSSALNFEAAAQTRDKIAALRRMQEQRVVTGLDSDLDVVALQLSGGQAALSVLSVRNGQLQGQRSHYPRLPAGAETAEVMHSFVEQFYSAHEAPAEIVLSHEPAEPEWLAQGLSARWQRRLQLKTRVRSTRQKLLDMALASADQALRHRLQSRQGLDTRLAALQQHFGLAGRPERIECFDISHSRGEATVASCVVFDQDGPAKSRYRRFNINDIEPGDDYAAIGQAVARRFRDTDALRPEDLPDVLLIDGGAGQLAAAMESLRGCGLALPLVIGVAKGSHRKPGLEQLFLPDREHPVRLEADDPALHLIQQVRDEAHRFAITGHRGRRGKARTQSELDEIPGLGPKRRHQLLRNFGGVKQLRRASIAELSKVPGISHALARRVYHHLHDNAD